MQVVPAGHGWRWFKAGFTLYRAQPIVWIALCFAYWSIMSIVALVPLVGFAASLVMVPIFSVSFMNIARFAELGRRPEFPMLMSGFRGRPKPLVMLGLVYLGLHVLLFAVLLIAAPGEAGEVQPLGDGGLDATGVRATLLRGAVLATALYLPIVAAFWYAPVLASWEGHAPGKALFFSFFAVLANWRAFLVYGLIATVLAAAVMFLGILILGGVGRDGGGSVLRFAVPLYVATLMPILFASFYASYRDVFPPPEADPKPLLEQGSS